MTNPKNQARFTLDQVQQAARIILADDPHPIVAHRLLREVLRLPPGDPSLLQAEGAAQNSKWVRQLAQAQLPDGSWGRFHSRDTHVKTNLFPTTESAIDRAFALGLPPGDAVLARVQQYIQAVLHGRVQLTDRPEKAELWSLLISLILAGRLAQIDPADPNLVLFWVYLEDVAESAFASGSYVLADEAAAHLRISSVHIPLGFLESQHALWILSAQPLPGWLDRSLVDWVWRKPDGIRYLRVNLTEPQPRQFGFWLRSMNILSRFPTWREAALDTFTQLWQQRGEDGLWDFGSEISRMGDFPISDSWRKVKHRRHDCTTCLLVLYRKFFD